MNKNKTNENLTLIQKYHDKAKIKLWKQYYVDKNNKLHGEYKTWYVNGQIRYIENFKDGKVHGKYQDSWPDGRICFVETNHFKKEEHGTKIIFKYGK